MASDPHQPNTEHKKDCAYYKCCAWKTIHNLGCWFAEAFRKPDNLPGFLGALFTLLLAIFAYKAWDESTRGTKALEGQLKAIQTDQRPVMSLTNDLKPPEFFNSTNAKGIQLTVGQIVWSWQFINVGRGVAYEFKYAHFLKVDNGSYEISYGSVPNPKVGINIPFGKTNFASAISKPGIERSDYDLAMKANRALGLLLEWSYKDIYGTSYSDTICVERLGGGAFAYIDPVECEKQKAK